MIIERYYLEMNNDILTIGGREFTSRLFVGTGKFSSPDVMLEAVKASGSQMITVAMKRVNMMNEATDEMMTHINREQHFGRAYGRRGHTGRTDEPRDIPDQLHQA